MHNASAKAADKVNKENGKKGGEANAALGQ